MKKLTTALMALMVLAASPARAEENWKGKPESANYTVGALAGMNISAGNVGFGLMGTGARKILENGFVPDINNPAWIELEIGPIFGAPFNLFYSTHLRWDFGLNDQWTFYALGGLAGFTGVQFELFPRFAAGAMMTLSQGIKVRAELGHEFIGAGVQFYL